MLVQTGLERDGDNKVKCEPVQTAAVDLLPNQSHATANVSLLARLQRLSTATYVLFTSQFYTFMNVPRPIVNFFPIFNKILTHC